MAEPLSPRFSRKVLLVCAAVVVGAGVGVALAATRTSSAPTKRTQLQLHGQAVWSSGQKPASDFSLRDQAGRTVSLSSQRGHVVLLAFLDSRCHSACPLDGAQLGRVARVLRGRPLDLVVVSVDPWADTPASARAFARHARWASGWQWLLGSKRTLKPIWRAYAIAVIRTPHDVVHTRTAYLIDPKGYVRAAYLFPLEPAGVVRDARSLLRAA